MVKNWLVRNEQRKLLTNISGLISGNSFIELHVGGADHQS
jgi:hypothetical protein